MMYELTNKKFKCMPSIAFRPYLTLVEVHMVTYGRLVCPQQPPS